MSRTKAKVKHVVFIGDPTEDDVAFSTKPTSAFQTKCKDIIRDGAIITIHLINGSEETWSGYKFIYTII